MASNTRIRIKIGTIELEYEGESAFPKKELMETLKDLLDLQKQHPSIATAPLGGHVASPVNSSSVLALSTDTIANILKANSGSELVLASAAHLHFSESKQTFTRAEIVAEMRAAPAFFKESYVNNLSPALKTLTKAGRLRFVSNDTYALSNTEKQKLEASLANT